jgi:pantetheine-phosphate adenylyltransferase
MTTKRIGIYPGTFDPVTKGHLHIIERASKLVDHLYVAVASNDKKAPLFNIDERMDMVRADIDAMHHKFCPITVDRLDTLLMTYARDKGATCVIRGLRAVTDFEYEFQMTGMNSKIAPDIETVFLMASDKWQFVSSSFLKEISSLGGDIEAFVTPNVLKRLQEKQKN